jgi:outer membrane biosynthesis protein TonB
MRMIRLQGPRPIPGQEPETPEPPKPPPGPQPVREPEPDQLPDEVPLPNPDEGDAPPQHAGRRRYDIGAGVRLYSAATRAGLAASRLSMASALASRSERSMKPPP